MKKFINESIMPELVNGMRELLHEGYGDNPDDEMSDSEYAADNDFVDEMGKRASTGRLFRRDSESERADSADDDFDEDTVKKMEAEDDDKGMSEDMIKQALNDLGKNSEGAARDLKWKATLLQKIKQMKENGWFEKNNVEFHPQMLEFGFDDLPAQRPSDEAHALSPKSEDGHPKFTQYINDTRDKSNASIERWLKHWWDYHTPRNYGEPENTESASDFISDKERDGAPEEQSERPSIFDAITNDEEDANKAKASNKPTIPPPPPPQYAEESEEERIARRKANKEAKRRVISKFKEYEITPTREFFEIMSNYYKMDGISSVVKDYEDLEYEGLGAEGQGPKYLGPDDVEWILDAWLGLIDREDGAGAVDEDGVAEWLSDLERIQRSERLHYIKAPTSNSSAMQNQKAGRQYLSYLLHANEDEIKRMFDGSDYDPNTIDTIFNKQWKPGKPIDAKYLGKKVRDNIQEESVDTSKYEDMFNKLYRSIFE